MDPLTHALSGALIARATAGAPTRAGTHTLPLARRVGLGFVAAAFPDVDVALSWLSPLAYLYYHRGVTPWRAYFGVFAWCIAIHIAGDLITSFGTMIFAPFSDARYALSTTFII